MKKDMKDKIKKEHKLGKTGKALLYSLLGVVVAGGSATAIAVPIVEHNKNGGNNSLPASINMDGAKLVSNDWTTFVITAPKAIKDNAKFEVVDLINGVKKDSIDTKNITVSGSTITIKLDNSVQTDKAETISFSFTGDLTGITDEIDVPAKNVVPTLSNDLDNATVSANEDYTVFTITPVNKLIADEMDVNDVKFLDGTTPTISSVVNNQTNVVITFAKSLQSATDLHNSFTFGGKFTGITDSFTVPAYTNDNATITSAILNTSDGTTLNIVLGDFHSDIAKQDDFSFTLNGNKLDLTFDGASDNNAGFEIPDGTTIYNTDDLEVSAYATKNFKVDVSSAPDKPATDNSSITVSNAIADTNGTVSLTLNTGLIKVIGTDKTGLINDGTKADINVDGTDYTDISVVDGNTIGSTSIVLGSDKLASLTDDKKPTNKSKITVSIFATTNLDVDVSKLPAPTIKYTKNKIVSINPPLADGENITAELSNGLMSNYVATNYNKIYDLNSITKDDDWKTAQPIVKTDFDVSSLAPYKKKNSFVPYMLAGSDDGKVELGEISGGTIKFTQIGTIPNNEWITSITQNTDEESIYVGTVIFTGNDGNNNPTGRNGNIYKSMDDGKTWTLFKSFDKQSVNSIYVGFGGGMVLAGLSDNTIVSFEEKEIDTLATLDGKVDAISYNHNMNVYAFGTSNGSIYKTNNHLDFLNKPTATVDGAVLGLSVDNAGGFTVLSLKEWDLFQPDYSSSSFSSNNQFTNLQYNIDVDKYLK